MSRTPSQPAGTPGGGKTGPSGQHPGRPAAAPPAVGTAPTPASAKAPMTPAATSTKAPAAAAASDKPADAAAQLKRRNLVIGGSAAAALALIVTLFVWKPWSPTPPRLNEDPATIAKWAASPRLHRLPFDQQRQFMELIDEKGDRVEEAYDQGMLSDQEFRRALQLGWYGEHLRKMDNFFSKPMAMRAMYLDKQVDKKIRKKKKKKDEPDEDAKSALKAEDIDRDDSTEERDIERWPSDVRQRWADYRAAYAIRKQFWKDYAKEQKAAQEAKKGDPSKGDPGKADPAKGPEAAVPTGQPAAQ